MNGVEESRTEFNSSRYNPSNKILAVGTATDNPEAAAQMAAAIASGDEATVRNVVAALAGDPAAQAALQAAAAQQPPAEQPPAEQPPAEQPPAEQPPANQEPIDQ